MRIHSLMHVPFEDAANIEKWAQDRGHTLNYTRLYDNETPPPLDAFDMLAVMGGPMNIDEHDAYPWLISEKQAIKQAIDAGKKVLGVCLGAQLIAAVLGARITPNAHKEIGWHPITLTEDGRKAPLLAGLPGQFEVFHWHGDTFALPAGAVRLAASAACANQAFQYGPHVLALQFHMEYSTQSIEKMLTHCSGELVDAPWIQDADTIRAGHGKVPQTTERLDALLDHFTAR